MGTPTETQPRTILRQEAYDFVNFVASHDKTVLESELTEFCHLAQKRLADRFRLVSQLGLPTQKLPGQQNDQFLLIKLANGVRLKENHQVFVSDKGEIYEVQYTLEGNETTIHRLLRLHPSVYPTFAPLAIDAIAQAIKNFLGVCTDNDQ